MLGALKRASRLAATQLPRPSARQVHNVAAFTSMGGKSYNEDRFVIGELDRWTLVAVMGMACRC